MIGSICWPHIIIRNLQKVENNLISSNIKSDTQVNISTQHYLFQTVNYNREFNISLNYYAALDKGEFLELGYSAHSISTKNSLVTRAIDSADNPGNFIDSLSNNFLFENIIQKIHSGYSLNENKLNLTLAADAQILSQQGKTNDKITMLNYTYFNLLPFSTVILLFLPTAETAF